MSVWEHHGIFPRTLIALVTLRCPLACAHCLVDSDPTRREEMSTDLGVRLAREAGRHAEVQALVLTGGEPFLNIGRLRAMLVEAERHALEVSIVTSGAWAISETRAAEVLAGLPPIANLTVSADTYHLDFLTLDHVRFALAAARRRGIELGAFVTLEHGHDEFPNILRAALGEDLWSAVRVMTRRVQLDGRAARTPAIVAAAERAPLEAVPGAGCPTASAPAVLPDGRVMACCGGAVVDPHRWPSLALGHLEREPLAAILARGAQNCLVHALRLLGPARLARAMAAEGVVFRDLYERHSPCDVCRDVATRPEVVARVRAYLARPDVSDELALGRLVHFGEGAGSVFP